MHLRCSGSAFRSQQWQRGSISYGKFLTKKRFSPIWLISCWNRKLEVLVWRDGVDEVSDCRPESLDGAFGSFARRVLQFRERHLGGVEVGTTEGEQPSSVDRFDCCPHGRTLVAAELVHDRAVTGGEFGHQDAIDVILGGVAFVWPVEHERRGALGQAQPRPHGRGFPIMGWTSLGGIDEPSWLC